LGGIIPSALQTLKILMKNSQKLTYGVRAFKKQQNTSVISAYEKRVKGLNEQMLVLEEKYR